MRKRLKFIVPGLLVVACVGLLWLRGRQSSVTPQSPAAKSSTVAASHPAIPAATNAVTAKKENLSAATTNRLAFRLSNTTRTIGQLERDRHAILLENAFIDTSAKVDLKIPSKLKAKGDPGAFIVQARGTIGAAFRSLITADGGQIISYIPNNAYLAQMSAGQAAALQGNPLVQAVLPYEPYYKVQSSLLGLAVNQDPLPPGMFLTLGLYGPTADATITQIQQLGGRIVSQDRSPFGLIIRVLAPQDWLALADLPGVQLVEPARLKKSANDLSRVSVGVSVDTVTNANYLNLNGSNVIVQVNDTGIDATHPDFTTGGNPTTVGTAPIRVIGEALVDNNGHGTHVAGTIAGNGSMSYSVANVPSGSVTNADFRGKAPLATLYSLNFNDTDSYLQEHAALANALISNNSWVNAGDNEYDLAAASYDAAVRDALPEVTGPQPVLFVFAAGDDGQGADDGTGGSADTIQSPATAKNVITVGSLEQLRNITNIVTDLNSNSSPIWLPETDSSFEVAAYSARGNVGVQTEGTFGRFKPDVVAPGTFVVSTRSTTWDQDAYFNPTNVSSVISVDNEVTSNTATFGTMLVPQNAVGLEIQVLQDTNFPVPFFTNMPIYISSFNIPDPTNPATYDFVTSNNIVAIPPDSGGTISGIADLQNNGIAFAVGDPTNLPVFFDLLQETITTNDDGNELQVLSNLDMSIGPWYRYETGTSMAAGSVSGVLALMQDFFTNTLHETPSPALLKAMLINGSRLTGDYVFAVTNVPNIEGWGQIEVSNSVPFALTNIAATVTNTPLFFVDQSPTNVLATGDQRTYLVSVPSVAAQSQLLRVTLAWTDPPGNPAAAIKLVNDLELVVTNLSNGEIYYENNFLPLGPPPISVASSSNDVPVFDPINNVKNIAIPPQLGSNYSVTVIGAAVNVNAVTTEETNIVQDFALVISCGDGNNTNGISVTPVAPPPTAILPRVAFLPSTNGIYFNQIAGSSAPWLNTNNVSFGTNSVFATNAVFYLGQTNQWQFYVVTNTSGYTNAAFITFLPNTLSLSREGVFANSEANSTRPEADLDLLVSSTGPPGSGDPNASSLTNLSPMVISNCLFGVNGDGASYGRGGTEFVAFSNSAPNQIYYIGVLAQDQTAGQYGFIPVFSQQPFSTIGPNGDQYVTGLNVPANIPVGNNAHPGSVYVFGLALYPMDIQRTIVTNTFFDQNFGDLIGAVTHNGVSAILNNHDGFGSITPATPLVYDDSGQGDITNLPTHSDGPGTLRNFIGQEAIGPWLLNEIDDGGVQTGSVTSFNTTIEPHSNAKKPSLVTVSIPPNTWYYDYVDVPVGYTNLSVFATNLSPTVTPPVQLTVQEGTPPTLSDTNFTTFLTNCFSGVYPTGTDPGSFVSVGPPLVPDRYYIGLYNSSTETATVQYGYSLAFNAAAITTLDYEGGPIVLPDDAVIYSTINVTNPDTIQDIRVGLRVDHPRISDMVFTLIDPNNNRYLLMENRGGQSAAGCGSTVYSTNIIPVSAKGGPAAQTNTIPVGNVGPVIISWNFFTVPDTMDVYYEGTNIFSTGLINGSGSTNLNFGPGTSTNIEVVMNATNHPATTAWTYTVGGISTNIYYLDFTEDTNLTMTPIKFASTPFTPSSVANVLWSDNFDTYTAGLYTPAVPSFGGGWQVLTNQVEIINTNPPAFSAPNELSMDDGAVSVTLPTVAGQTYSLQYEFGNNGTDGGSTVSTNAGWILITTNFTATAASQTLVLDASGDSTFETNFIGDIILAFTTNTVLDNFELTTVPGNLYYQAEQSLSPIVGTPANGTGNPGDTNTWKLEALDNRAGGDIPIPVLDSWQLEFEFANTNIPTTPNIFTTGPVSGTVPAFGIVWYQINPPTNAIFATNTVITANPAINLFWSTNVPPTYTNATDVLLLGNSLGGPGAFQVIGTNSATSPFPPAYFTPGGTYYLGVQNSNSVSATYSIDVTYDLIPEAPSVTTEAATNITSSTATLDALVVPNALQTTLYFEYGTTTNYGLLTTNLVLTNNLNLSQYIGIGVTNLSPGTIYHFQAIATNSLGTNYGGDLTFTNLAGNAPFAFTMPGTLLTGPSAQLNGMATPNGLDSMAWFEWGSSTAYGTQTAPLDVGTNFGVVYVTNLITGLNTNQPYHFRLDVSNALGVVYGFDHVFAQANVVAWGNDGQDETLPLPTGLTNLVVGIGAGETFSLALNYNGTVVVWGDGHHGETNVPPNLTNAVSVSGGYAQCIALKSDGSVAEWGQNHYLITNVVPVLTNAVQAVSEANDGLALTANGYVVAWGANNYNEDNVPVGLSNVVEVAGGLDNTLALKNDGTVVAWGDDFDFQSDVPDNATNVAAIAAGDYFSMALRNDGTVVVWGNDDDGQTNVPTGLTNVIAIAGGGYHALALRSDGTVVVWGDNSDSLNVLPPGLSNVVAVAAGEQHSLALSSIYGLNETNTPPFWTNGVNGSTVTMDQYTTMNVTNTATDTNYPPETLNYTLQGAPTWASITFQGIITLAPQQPGDEGTYTITTVVVNNGHPALSNTNSFTLVVNSINTAPFYPPTQPTNYLILATNPFVLTDTASQTNIPAYPLTYTLLAGPADAMFDTNSGTITWPTTAAEIGVTTQFVVVATDNDPLAVNSQTLSATNTFTVTVVGAQTGPYWPAPIPNQVMDAPTNFTLVVTALDADVPPPNLTYSLSGAPLGMTISTVGTNGVIDWPPSLAQVPGVYNIQVIVSDNVLPTPDTATNNLNLTVIGLGSGQTITNTVAPNSILWSPVRVPLNAIAATNTLVYATTAINLWYSTNVPPTITNSTDVELLTNAASGVSVITESGRPTLVPGSVYYLGVQNTNAIAVTNALNVTFELIPPPTLSITATNLGGMNGYLLAWSAPTNEQFHLDWTPSLSPVNWQEFKGVISFVSYVTATNSQFSYFDNGTQAGPFGMTRFYRLKLLNSPTNTAPYFVNGTPPGMSISPLSTITVTNGAADYDIPAQTLTYTLATTDPGSNAPAITSMGVITWTPDPTLAGTTNYFTTTVTDNGVPAKSASNTFAVIVSGTPMFSFSGIQVSSAGVNLQWTAPTNDEFDVRWATNLVPPIAWTNFPGPITSTSNTFNYLDTNTPSTMKFYQLLLLP